MIGFDVRSVPMMLLSSFAYRPMYPRMFQDLASTGRSTGTLRTVDTTKSRDYGSDTVHGTRQSQEEGYLSQTYFIPVWIRQMLAPKRTDVFDVLYRIQYCTYELMIGCFGSGDEHV